MKKLLLFLLLTFGYVNGQTVLFEDSFETYDDFIISGIGNWTLVDNDLRPTYGFTGVTYTNTSVAKSFQVFNSTATTPALSASSTSDWSAKTGDKNIVCIAAVPGAGVTANNDWLISPQITLGTSGNMLSFWAKSCSAQYGLEKFKVGISTTNTSTTSFTLISDNPVVTLDDVTYAEYTYNLDAYAGQSIYISINCVSDDQFGFAIDDFLVTSAAMSSDNFFSSNFLLSPNPVKDIFTVNAKNNVAIQNITVVDINGRLVNEVNNSNSSDAMQVNIGELNAGVYFVKVQTELGVGTSKIIKK
ncbi:choice-of-anchor J domain-containing protein [Flavobacterium sp.]|jgi:hypothetical protein|uniref:choice-of-anchor J domain-containing protein n=1 Tax=Flavobacterium sp. TaxID=239 RepID=UPI0037C16EFC